MVRLSIYIYKTEAFETPTIFHVSIILKKNHKQKKKKKKLLKPKKILKRKIKALSP